MASIINVFEQIYYFFSGNKYLHGMKVFFFIVVTYLFYKMSMPGLLLFPVMIGLYLLVLALEFVVFVKYEYTLGIMSSENEQLKEQSMPTVIIASGIPQSEMEKFGRLFLAITTIEGLPNKKFLDGNIHELSKQTGLPIEEIRLLYGKTHLHMAEFLSKSERPYCKVGFVVSPEKSE